MLTREGQHMPHLHGAASGVTVDRPLVAHILYRFDTGGLENGLVNLINALPADGFRHAVIALDRVEPVFAARADGEAVSAPVQTVPPPAPRHRAHPQPGRAGLPVACLGRGRPCSYPR